MGQIKWPNLTPVAEWQKSGRDLKPDHSSSMTTEGGEAYSALQTASPARAVFPKARGSGILPTVPACRWYTRTSPVSPSHCRQRSSIPLLPAQLAAPGEGGLNSQI